MIHLSYEHLKWRKRQAWFCMNKIITWGFFGEVKLSYLRQNLLSLKIKNRIIDCVTAVYTCIVLFVVEWGGEAGVAGHQKPGGGAVLHITGFIQLQVSNTDRSVILYNLFLISNEHGAHISSQGPYQIEKYCDSNWKILMCCLRSWSVCTYLWVSWEISFWAVGAVGSVYTYKGKVFYGQEPPSGESTAPEWGVNY